MFETEQPEPVRWLPFERIRTIAVIGAGYMGGGIAQSLAASGYEVVIADSTPEAGRKALDRIIAETHQFETLGLLLGGSLAAVKTNLRAANSLTEAVDGVDFVAEAVFEDLSVKGAVLSEIDSQARPDAIIGSNTSTISVSDLASSVSRPERFLTVHWSNPAPFIPGVEVVVGSQTDLAVVPVVRKMLAVAGKDSAVVADKPGFVLNRLQYALLREACLIVEEGVTTIKDLDTIVRSTFGFRLPFFGPFAIADMAGLDIYASGFKTLEREFGSRFSPPKLIEAAVESGTTGLKSGNGLTGSFDAKRASGYVDYRSVAYATMAKVLQELGSPDRD